ncbi:MAG: DUF1800 domain-containing protein [Chloroflexi bacterium AL-W]|nr:DUF1800 domain-containing protein [Chloroflexi bacterium AL-N1]NOK68702.1 DUF1800 domain-containing protein [Chloroflexi bacterium AL-N10]NOK76188.1 DUF1800 domain-containing protein [Chloroflexi bacterium AL-N5]NOK84175.1 DUF1800 domain-containing protein [Chloroflexi bacterium AL-W]NOK91326.1 DUF1800 domain-containing protein [Chloroflexi bacterium AL-N15]
MPLTRRKFLRQSGLVTASTLLAACSPAQEWLVPRRTLDDWPTANDTMLHALNRMTFGPTADERAYANEIGLHEWIEEQLAPESINDLRTTLRLQRFDILAMDTSLIFDVREEPIRREFQQIALVRAIYSRRQLYEVMVDFWSDHFNISTLKMPCAWLKPIDDREVIRPHALGNFRDLLWASMQSPAMLLYLDNQENFAGNPNENYARELMELHTLGIDGGYTQKDVQEVARCLTGWSVDDVLCKGQFQFKEDQHDDTAKTVLGQHIPAGNGQRDGELLCDMLVEQPATARFIATKLVRRFVADDPPEFLVAAAAATFTQTRGDIKDMLRTILHSEEFAAAAPKFKRPLHFVAGMLRQLNADTNASPDLLEAMALMGQPLFQWPTPDGYPDYTDAWRDTLMPRWRFALALTTGNIEGTAIDLEALMRASGTTTTLEALDQFATLLGFSFSQKHKTALVEQFGAELTTERLLIILATLLASPYYQWR